MKEFLLKDGMKGLLLKDWYMMKKYCKTYFVIAAVFLFTPFVKSMPTLIATSKNVKTSFLKPSDVPSGAIDMIRSGISHTFSA